MIKDMDLLLRENVSTMKLNEIKLVNKGKKLKRYDLCYTNKIGKEKIYEIVSRNYIKNIKDLGSNIVGVTIVAFSEDKEQMLLLKEFRPAVNKYVVNFVSGLIDDNEGIEDTIIRELFEETGITKDRIKIDRILKSSYSSIGMTDEKVSLAYVTIKMDGLVLTNENTSSNEVLNPFFADKTIAKEMLENFEFTSRTQAIVDVWVNGV